MACACRKMSWELHRHHSLKLILHLLEPTNARRLEELVEEDNKYRQALRDNTLQHRLGAILTGFQGYLAR
jgi:hypothetical protein